MHNFLLVTTISNMPEILKLVWHLQEILKEDFQLNNGRFLKLASIEYDLIYLLFIFLYSINLYIFLLSIHRSKTISTLSFYLNLNIEKINNERIPFTILGSKFKLYFVIFIDYNIKFWLKTFLKMKDCLIFLFLLLLFCCLFIICFIGIPIVRFLFLY